MPRTRQPPAPPPGEAYLAAPVADVASRPALWIESGAQVSEAARRMLETGTGSILVRAPKAGGGDDGPGIVTDRDLRRVLAKGIAPQTPVGQVASRPLLTLDADASVAAAHLAMLEAGVRHLALLDGSDQVLAEEAEKAEDNDDRIVGVVSASDLHRHHSRGPFFVLHRLDRAGDRATVTDYVVHRNQAVRSLRLGGVAADRIGRIASHLDDHLVRRCLRDEIETIESESGPLPTDWAWVAFGSDGRREQPVLVDQHNALVFDLSPLDTDAAASASEIFHLLAARVSERLRVAGWPEPDGGFVARRWCTGLAEWRRRFHHWLEEPDAETLEHAQVFFDLRRVMGPLDVGLGVTLTADDGAPVEPSTDFLHLLSAMAVRRRPAVGRWRGLTQNGSGGVDLMAGGLRPLVALTRVLGVCLGLAGSADWPTSTTDRLEAAGQVGLLPRAEAERLAELYEYLADRCLDLHLHTHSATIRPVDLGRHERRRLTSGLRFLRRQQRALDGHVRRYLRAASRGET